MQNYQIQESPKSSSMTGTDVSMYESGIGGLTSAYAQYMAGRTNRRIANWNAAQARVQAAQAKEAGGLAANRVSTQEAETLGRQRGAEAGAGIVAGAGTARNVEASSQAASEMDKTMIELNARRAAYGFQMRAASDTAQGRIAEQQGEMGGIASLLNTQSQLWLESDQNYGGYRGKGIAGAFG